MTGRASLGGGAVKIIDAFDWTPPPVPLVS